MHKRSLRQSQLALFILSDFSKRNAVEGSRIASHQLRFATVCCPAEFQFPISTFQFREFPFSRFGILPLLQLLGQLQLALRIFGSAQFAVRLSQQMMRNGIVGIHRQRSL